MNSLTIIQIFNKIARTYPQSECGGINGFGTLHDGAIMSDNIGKTYEDYQKGFFWSRQWEENGALKDDLSLEYPALFIEYKKSKIPSLMEIKMCDDLYVLVVDNPDCPDCPKECSRNRDEIKKQTKDTLKYILKELFTYRKYECTETVDDKEVTYNSWMSEGEYEYMEANCPDVSCRKTSESVRGGIKYKDIRVQEWNHNGKIGAIVDIEVCGCDNSKVEFDYSKKEFKVRGVTECESC